VKMSQQEEVVGGLLEAKGRALTDVVAEHMSLCFHS
jgi:hypothetical protein